ncbi:hypothetical protein HQQ80_15000 [Microbacteriaceae bacterium VKM Ac-2855]|nr:hypothetical protein [Microbacteriaceae bacterium VKM Ac-2855]
MTDGIYTAVLDSGTEQESIRLELIQGEPQSSITRLADLDGEEVEVVWELDGVLGGAYVYRPLRVEARDDDSGEVGGDLTSPKGTDAYSAE